MLIAIVSTVVIAGAGAWFYMHGMPAVQANESAPSKPLFVTLDPFTVNLAGGEEHFLQVGLVYQVQGPAVADHMKSHLPILRNRILLLLSAKQPSELSTADGKKKLVDELVSAARESIPGNSPDKGVTTALLGSFVIQ